MTKKMLLAASLTATLMGTVASAENIGVSMALCRGRTVLVADTAVHDMPDAEELADIAEEAAGTFSSVSSEIR